MNFKEIDNEYFWIYFATDGFPQLWTIGKTKKDSRELIKFYYPNTNYIDYENVGWVLKKIKLNLILDV